MVIAKSHKVFGDGHFVDGMVSILLFAVLVVALCLVDTDCVTGDSVSDLNHLGVVTDGCSRFARGFSSLKEGVVGLKERVTSDKTEALKTAMTLSKTRQLPKLLKELFGLVQGVDALRTIVTHVFFLANPISWLLFVLSCLAVFGYVLVAVITALFFVL